MCGIAGIFTLERPTTSEDVEAVKRMMDAQIHRGPDGFGIHRNNRAVLGHRRLSILDLSDAGRQPMTNEDGTVWVTYNGEIYNFQELRNDLTSRGHRFKSRTDTEVLVHGYEEWGIQELLTRLRGMFAFALYDTRASEFGPRLILAKDRFGIKPLYYSYQKGQRLLFASEVQAISKAGMVSDDKEPAALIRFLQLGSIPVPMTTIKGVLALPAAHYAVADDRGFHLTQYWDLSNAFSPSASSFSFSNLEGRDFEQITLETRKLLEESVRLHLISDVPLGVFLSGGLDSSALVAIASKFREKPITTVSIVFDELEYSEAQYSRIVADRYHTDHREILLRSKDLVEGVHGIFAAMDQPTIDGVNTFLVSKAAKEAGLTVVLSGLGGDEVFLGYNHFRKANALEKTWRLFTSIPPGWRRACISLATQLGALVGKTGLEKLAYLEGRSHEDAYLLFRGLFSPKQIQELLGIDEAAVKSDLPSFQGKGQSTKSLVGSLNILEFQHYLQNQLLRDTDVMSMAHSIETRVPFLDHKLVEYVVGLPTKLKLHGCVNKPLLVNAVGNCLPREIWARQKMGFTFPFARWLKDHADDLQAVTQNRSMLDKKAVGHVWQEFLAGRLHWSRAWATVVAGQVA